jgi:putative DNA primase/helicase
MVALLDLSSPVAAFVRERCRVGADLEVSVGGLWTAWKEWAEDNGHGRGGNRQTFGRDLRAAVPRVRISRPRDGEERHRFYVGLTVIRADEVAQ